MSIPWAKIGIVAAVVIAGSPAHGFISNDAFDNLYYLTGYHCGMGRPQPYGDWPIRVWRREVQICNRYHAKLDRITRRCKLRLPENNYACSILVREPHVSRYPPPDPRRRE